MTRKKKCDKLKKEKKKLQVKKKKQQEKIDDLKKKMSELTIKITQLKEIQSKQDEMLSGPEHEEIERMDQEM